MKYHVGLVIKATVDIDAEDRYQACERADWLKHKLYNIDNYDGYLVNVEDVDRMIWEKN